MNRAAPACLATGLLLGAVLSLSGCGGGGTVYVGVGVAGPWVGPGYPGYYPPPVMGPRPPCCWDDDGQDGAQDRDALDPVPLLEWIGVPDSPPARTPGI